MGRRTAVLIFSCLLSFVVIHAQSVRDYAITEISSEFANNEATFKVIVVVENHGADATAPTDVIVTLPDNDDTVLAVDTLAPLASGNTIILQIELPINDFPAGTEQTIQVAVGIDAFELADTDLARDNIATIVVTIPETNPNFSPATFFKITDDGIIFLGETYSRLEAVTAIGATVPLLLLLWMITIILRLVFSRPPSFGRWQSPYGLMPMYDQYSVEGRRWAWQQHAQNNLLLAPPSEGYIHPVKLLVAADGRNLANWKVRGLRLSQYDVYGRISRTQAVANKKWVRRLNKIIDKRPNYSEQKLQNSLRPVAAAIVKQYVQRISKKSAFLPVAFDIRWEGKHGEVGILFELYQFQNELWYRIDRWEAMLQIISQTVQENYTFTMHGKEPSENMRDFRERLHSDLMWLLLEMLRHEPVADQNDSEPVARQQYTIPDTLSDIQPVPTEDEPVSVPAEN